MVRYNKPPIIESLCEIRFTDDTNWDITIPGLVFQDVREVYHQKEQRRIQEIKVILPKGPSGATQHQIRKRDLAVFLTEDKKSLIQVGPRILSVSRLKPYGTWDDFKSQIDYAFGILNGRAELRGIQSIHLKYINKVDIPIGDKREILEKYFNFRLYCGEGLPQEYGGFIAGCIFSFSEGNRDLCRVELRDAASEIEGSMAFLLNIDYFLAKPRSIPIARTIEWVEEAHETVKKLFEGCILPPLREIFEEVK